MSNSLHPLTPSSQSLPLPPSPPGSHKSILQVHDFLFCGKVHLCLILDSRYKWYHMVFVFLFLTYFIQDESIQFHPCYCKWHYFVLFYGWVVFRCVYIPYLLNPIICQRTFRLFPCLGYCEQCCNEHVHMSFSRKVLSRYMARSGTAGSYGSIFNFLR